MKITGSMTAIVAVVCFGISQADAALIGHWKLDETSGTVAADSVNGNDGNYVASDDPVPGWQPGIIGGAAGLNDEDDNVAEYFSIASIPQMDGASQLTVSIWFNQNDGDNTNDSNNGLFRAQELDGTGRDAGLNEENNTIDARMTSGGPNAADSAGFSADPGWHHAALTWDANDDSGGPGTGTIKVYLDGAFSASNSTTALSAAVISSGDWAIGNDNCCGNDRGWTGALDDAAMWDVALSDGDIARIYAGGLRGLDAPTALAVPEPASLAMVTLVILGLVGTRRAIG